MVEKGPGRMKRKVIGIAVFWSLFATVHPVFAGEVNIDHSAFQGGVWVIPENQLEGEIKVNLSEPVNTTDATVVCHPLESGPGFTAVEFENSTAPIGTTELEVLFRVKHPGRPIQIQCTAQSRGNNTQYTLSESRGNIGSLQVSKAPTVVICPKVIVLHKYQPVSSIEVQFSEKITGFPVSVNCFTLEQESGELPELEIIFKETYVEIDQTTAKVPYEVKSFGFPVLVTCRARSVNMSWPVVSTSAVTQLTTGNMSRPINGTVTPSAGWITAASLITSATMSSMGGSVGRRWSLGISSQSGTSFQYWYNNSAGPPAIFAFDVSPLRILPSSGFIRTPDGVFRAVLALDQPAENTVDVTCSLGTVSPSSDLGNESGLCFIPPADTVTFANSSLELKLSVKEIQFEKGELFKNIDLTLNGTPSWRTQSLVRVVCCGKDTGLSLRYNNESAVMFAWVELRKQQPVDWDQIDGSQRTSTSESDVVLDCPCNLKENSCDVGCCCDQDCSDFENKSSICIPGFFGGATSERTFEFSCQATWPDATDWQPFLCVAINNSPVIGYFYNFSTPRSAEDTLSYNTLKDKGNSPTHSFSESEDRSVSISSVAYSAGTAIKTAANTDEASYARAVLGVLSLPNNIFSGLCSQMSPVRFLEDFVSSCVHELEESLCTSSSPVSALTYLMPIKLNQPACPFPPAVLAEGRLNDTLGGAPKLAVTEVQYYCMDISEHVSMTNQDDIQNDQIPSLFARGAAKGDSPVRCEFDDGQTTPPAPAFNRTTRLCSNVVVKVEYEFSWSGSQIIAVLAKVTVGNVTIPTKPRNSGLATSQAPIRTISQSFSVKFLHSFQNSSSSNQTTGQRSGNPGYVRGRPVLSRVVTNSTVVSVGHIHLWSPSGDSLCADSSLTPVLFGQDTFSGCLLRLSHEDLLNCSRLKQLVRTNQDRLIQATHVGRRGNADVTVSNDWLPIVKEQLNNSSESSLGNSICPGIPSGLVIEMLVSEAGKHRGEPQMEIVGTRVSYQFATWQYKCTTGTGASCSQPTSNATNSSVVTSLSPSPSITLTLTNTIVTQNSSRPSINASITNSSGNTNSGDKTEARQYRSRFQYFLVSSSVVFIKVPPEKPARLKRTADHTGICYNDVCREELFYPLTTAYTGEPREKAMALSLFLIFLSFVVFAVTRPWG